MKEILHIGEVAEQFGLPKATLRYWQSEELFRDRREDNGYRRFTVQDLLTLSDVVYYRDLHMPIKKIKTIPSKTPQELDILLAESEDALSAEITRLETAQRETRRRRGLHRRARALEEAPYQLVVPPLRRVVSFDFTQRDKLRKSLHRPDLSVAIYPGGDLARALDGLDVTDDEQFGGEPALWELPAQPARYAACLIKNSTDWKESDLTVHLERLHRRGEHTGDVVARYLFSAYNEENGMFSDYFEAFIALV